MREDKQANKPPSSIIVSTRKWKDANEIVHYVTKIRMHLEGKTALSALKVTTHYKHGDGFTCMAIEEAVNDLGYWRPEECKGKTLPELCEEKSIFLSMEMITVSSKKDLH